MSARTLDDWLLWLEGVHPQAIDLGTERIARVADRLGLRTGAAPILTVAGTNGKGSTVACLEAIYRAAGYTPGAYTSPHLLRFNERIRVSGQPVEDAAILAAFEAIEAARGDITLTYFEFATLAAAWCFNRAKAWPWILEVGLGGRLDATNTFDADLAVITAIDLDHMEWLGDNREAIAGEKMGIARAHHPVVCADPKPPARIQAQAKALPAELHQLGQEFDYRVLDATTWQWQSKQQTYAELPRPGWLTDHTLANAAGALAAVTRLQPQLPVSDSAVARGLAAAQLAGRQQRLTVAGCQWLLDVGHNPAAIAQLAERLGQWRAQQGGRVRLAFALLARKPLDTLVEALAPVVDEWFVLDLGDADAHSVEAVCQTLLNHKANVMGTGDGAAARVHLMARARPIDLNVAAGSFRVVEALMQAGVVTCNPDASDRH